VREFLHVFSIAAGLILVYLLLSHTTTNGILTTLSDTSINGIKALQGR
jgi:hypothetical protein